MYPISTIRYYILFEISRKIAEWFNHIAKVGDSFIKGVKIDFIQALDDIGYGTHVVCHHVVCVIYE